MLVAYDEGRSSKMTAAAIADPVCSPSVTRELMGSWEAKGTVREPLPDAD